RLAAVPGGEALRRLARTASPLRRPLPARPAGEGVPRLWQRPNRFTCRASRQGSPGRVPPPSIAQQYRQLVVEELLARTRQRLARELVTQTGEQPVHALPVQHGPCRNAPRILAVH